MVFRTNRVAVGKASFWAVLMLVIALSATIVMAGVNEDLIGAAKPGDLPEVDPERDRLLHAESLYAQGKATEALNLAFEVQRSEKHHAAAASLISKISTKYLVVTSDPPGLEVFCSPISALGQLPKGSDPKTSLAKSFGKTGVPRIIGCKDFLIGLTPLALKKPAKPSVIAILYKENQGTPVATKRAFNGTIELRCKVSVRLGTTPMGGVSPMGGMTPMVGCTPLEGSIILWDDATKKSGQIQMISSGQLTAVSVFWRYVAPGSPVHVKFTSEELYESLADKKIPLEALK